MLTISSLVSLKNTRVVVLTTVKKNRQFKARPFILLGFSE